MSVTIHTSVGDLKVEIFCDTAPRTAFNFLALAASGAYDQTTFHRNIKGFMIQAGDTAEKTGTKGGESIWGATAFPDEFHPNNLHDRRGVLSMANKGASKIDRSLDSFVHLTRLYSVDSAGPNTNRSQFFICYERQPHLNNLHTVFGRLLDGWDILDKMEALPVLGPAAPKKKLEHRPVEPPVITGITVHANPLADEMIVYPKPDGPPEKRL